MKTASLFYIDGKWVEPASAEMSDLIDPATETPYARAAMGSAEDVDRAAKAARRAFASYSKSSVEERIALLERIAVIFERRQREFAETVTQEVGMPISISGTALIDWCKAHTAATIEILRKFEFAEKLGTTTVYKEPIGVVGMITPWNWPIGQIFTKILPALATGCTMVLKPSQLTPLDAVLVAEVLDEAGVPAGVFNLVNGEGHTVGDAISTHPEIDMVSFTGSTRAGIQIGKASADTIKRVVTELGGKSANIILDDADFPTAIESAVAGCFFINGQACDAGTRLLVPRGRVEETLKLAAAAAERNVIGSPADPKTTLGPVINKNQFERVQHLILTALDEGASLVTGGLGRPDGLKAGYYVKPTIFANVEPSMTVYREEIFGPVLSVIAYDDLDDAIRIANDTVYGLAAHITGKDMDVVQRLAREVRAGSVFVNSPDLDPMAPFGGYRQSGNGRENGEYGFHDFLEVKAVVGHG
ncbi:MULTISPECIES: aldehyde dehydrogenase family protein [Rhizobium]|uniref:Aldehyde dehydrogenase n=2 Tax=Rhizobium TaxID=379 RepID=A0A109J706_9HYPH|nr:MULTISPECIES: aldehyde dehydrogenase family protein [Rhizobium]KWV43439.1 aldehyde dehydrogenase [Rhizobium altiplani]CCM80025.1 putative aldehyde dehydrogenase SE_1720 [Rhizobium mesoamericanum STM3625]